MNICGLMKVTLLDFPGHVACTVFTGGCNMRCPFCHNSELLGFDAEPVMSLDELYAFLDKRRGRLEGVAVTGGEPTLHRDLPEILKRIKNDFEMLVKLDTNGTDPDMLSEILEGGLADYVAIDIKAAPDNYAKAAGIDISGSMLKRISRSKDMLINGLNGKITAYEFRTTVVGGLHTDEDFYGIREYIRGAENYFLQAYAESDNVLHKDRGFYTPSKDEMQLYADIVKPMVRYVGIRGMD